MVRFWPSSRSWHVPHRIRSISSEQQTRRTSWTIVSLKRKPRTLLSQLEVPLRHPQLPSPSSTSATATSLSDHIYTGSFTRRFNSNENHPTSRSPDPYSKGLPRRLPSHVGYTQQQDSLIHGVSDAVRLSPRSKCFSAHISVGTVMDSWGYLCTLIPTIRRYYLSSYEKIATCKSCSYGDP